MQYNLDKEDVPAVTPFRVNKPQMQEPDTRDPNKAKEIRPVLMFSPILQARGSGFADLTPHVAPVVEEAPVVISEPEGSVPKASEAEQDLPVTVNAPPSGSDTTESGLQSTEKDLHPSAQSVSPAQTASVERVHLLVPPLS